MMFTSDGRTPSLPRAMSADGAVASDPGEQALIDGLLKAGGQVGQAVIDQLATKNETPPPPPPSLFGNIKPTDMILAGSLLAVGAVVVFVLIRAVKK